MLDSTLSFDNYTRVVRRIQMDVEAPDADGISFNLSIANRLHRSVFRYVAYHAWLAKQRGPAELSAFAETARRVYPYLDRAIFPSVESEAVREAPSVLKGIAGSPGMTAEWFKPRRAQSRGIVFYIHGGSFIAERSPRVTDFMSRICASAGARVFAPKYRLAPDAPCPAAVDDTVVAYRWLVENIPDEPIVALAESSGASVLLAAIQRLRDQGERLPLGILLFSPWVDLALTGWSIIAATLTASSPHTMDTCALCAQLYLAGRSPTDPLASPVYGSFEGFPPVQAHVSRTDVLFDDAEKLAKRLSEFHVPMTVREWKSQTHVWERYTRNPAAKLSIQTGADFIRQRLDEA
jgi:epsilon-lactone hydrolase